MERERRPREQSDRARGSQTQPNRTRAAQAQSNRTRAAQAQPNRTRATQTQSNRAHAAQTQSNRARAAQTQAQRNRETLEQRRKRVIRNRLIAAGILLALIILVIVLIVSCGNKKKQQSEPESVPAQTTENMTEPESETAAEPKTVDIPNEKPIHLYTMNEADWTCYKITELKKTWSEYEDLEVFGAFCSTEDSFPFTSEIQAQKDSWNSIETTTEYKIGYELSFDVGSEHKVITILEPGDIENNPDLYNGDYPEDGDYSGITGYLGAWLYDDLHQEEGVGYIHITQAEVTDETLLTSIKLRPTPQSDQISNLVLKGFTYSSDQEFDEAGHYIGNYASQVTIERE